MSVHINTSLFRWRQRQQESTAVSKICICRKHLTLLLFDACRSCDYRRRSSRFDETDGCLKTQKWDFIIHKFAFFGGETIGMLFPSNLIYSFSLGNNIFAENVLVLIFPCFHVEIFQKRGLRGKIFLSRKKWKILIPI